MRSFQRVVVLLIVAALVAYNKASELPTTEEDIASEDRWAHMSDLNTPHELHTAVVVDGKLYAVGGTQYTTREPSEFEQYDPAANRWTILPNMPTPRVFLGAAAVQKSIYAIGGIGKGLDFHATVEVYDLADNTWYKRADLPTPRNRFSAIAFDGSIYAIGGLSPQGDTGIVEAYDPDTDRWVRKADMPTSRHGHSAVVVDDRILVVGGYSGGPIATVEAYNPAIDQWTRKKVMPTPRGFLGLATAKGYVYAIAGRVPEANPIERYDPFADAWERVGMMPGSFRNRFGTGVVDDLIYVIGGEFQGDEQIPISVLRYDPDDATAVEEISSGIPSSFALEQNYPNPFNPTTTIPYSLSVGAKVKLTIYNLTGQKVATLVNKDQQPGTYSVQWDGKDESGRIVASGVYTYRLEAPETTEIRKLVLIR